MPFLRLLFQRYQRVYPLPADFLFQPACGFGDVFGKPVVVAVVAQCGGVVGVVADGEVAAAEMVAALQTRAFCRIPFAAAFAAVARAGADVVGKRGIGFVVGEGFNSFPARIGQGFFLLADMGAGFVQQVVQRGLPVFLASRCHVCKRASKTWVSVRSLAVMTVMEFPLQRKGSLHFEWRAA